LASHLIDYLLVSMVEALDRILLLFPYWECGLGQITSPIFGQDTFIDYLISFNGSGALGK
jgi:hypothetical protein